MNVFKSLCAVSILMILMLTMPGPAPAEQGSRRAGPGVSGGILLAQAPSGAHLGDTWSDPQIGFAINPPAQWYQSTRNRRFAVRFSDRRYQSFIMVDVVPVDSKVTLDKEFRVFINDKNKEVKETIPSFQVLGNRAVSVNRVAGYRTEATFKAGPNGVFMSIYYVPSNTRIFMITTVCPEATLRQWEPVFKASVATFTILE
jgi:hypothetical protein